MDNNGKYLVQNYSIKYIQSLSTWVFLHNRTYDKREKNILAVGNAIYNSEKYDG